MIKLILIKLFFLSCLFIFIRTVNRFQNPLCPVRPGIIGDNLLVQLFRDCFSLLFMRQVIGDLFTKLANGVKGNQLIFIKKPSQQRTIVGDLKAFHRRDFENPWLETC